MIGKKSTSPSLAQWHRDKARVWSELHKTTVSVQPLNKAPIRGILAILILASKITDELVGFREDTLFSF